MTDTATQVRAILKSTFGELAQVTPNESIKSVLQGIGNALGPQDGDTTRGKSAAGRTAPVTAAKAPKRSARKPPGSSSRAATVPRAPRMGRREELLDIIEKRPGVTVAQAAKEIGIAPAGLYPVAKRLQADGLVRKEGTGWSATAATKTE